MQRPSHTFGELSSDPVLIPVRFGRLLLPLALLGMADLLAAAAINGVAPWAVARAVAAGLIGLGALKGGLAASLLGLALQVAMTLVIGFVWWSMAPWFARRISRRAVLGIALGLVVFVVMNFVVVPLSAIGRFPKFDSVPFLLAHVTAMLVYGLAISFLTLRRA